MDSQVFILNEKRNVTLTAYLQDDSQEFWRAKKRPAVVIFPGGAYAYCSDREADPVAQEYLRAGYYAFGAAVFCRMGECGVAEPA